MSASLCPAFQNRTNAESHTSSPILSPFPSSSPFAQLLFSEIDSEDRYLLESRTIYPKTSYAATFERSFFRHKSRINKSGSENGLTFVLDYQVLDIYTLHVALSHFSIDSEHDFLSRAFLTEFQLEIMACPASPVQVIEIHPMHRNIEEPRTLQEKERLAGFFASPATVFQPSSSIATPRFPQYVGQDVYGGQPVLTRVATSKTAAKKESNLAGRLQRLALNDVKIFGTSTEIEKTPPIAGWRARRAARPSILATQNHNRKQHSCFPGRSKVGCIAWNLK